MFIRRSYSRTVEDAAEELAMSYAGFPMSIPMSEVVCALGSPPQAPSSALVKHNAEVRRTPRLKPSVALAMIRFMLVGVHAQGAFDTLSVFGRVMVCLLLQALQGAAQKTATYACPELTFPMTDLQNVLRVMDDDPVLAAAVS